MWTWGVTSRISIFHRLKAPRCFDRWDVTFHWGTAIASQRIAGWHWTAKSMTCRSSWTDIQALSKSRYRRRQWWWRIEQGLMWFNRIWYDILIMMLWFKYQMLWLCRYGMLRESNNTISIRITYWLSSFQVAQRPLWHGQGRMLRSFSTTSTRAWRSIPTCDLRHERLN